MKRLKVVFKSLIIVVLIFCINRIDIKAADDLNLIPGETMEGIVNGNSSNTYLYRVPDNGYVNFHIKYNLNEGYDNIKITLSDENQNLYYSKLIVSTGEITISDIGFKKNTLLKLKISNTLDILNKANNNYQITTNYSKSDNWEFEANNYEDEANDIKSNEEYKGNLYSSNDVDYFKYSSIKSGYITFDFKNFSNGNSFHNGWNLEVFNADINDEPIYSCLGILNNLKEKILLPAGTYVIKISANNLSFAPIMKNYKLKIIYSDSTISKMEIRNISSTRDKQVKLIWREIKNIDGYQLQYSDSKTFNNPKNLNVSKSFISKTIKNLISGKKYYFRIRGYRNDINGKKVYGAFSNIKSLKVK